MCRCPFSRAVQLHPRTVCAGLDGIVPRSGERLVMAALKVHRLPRQGDRPGSRRDAFPHSECGEQFFPVGTMPAPGSRGRDTDGACSAETERGRGLIAGL
jgi:hypothetical protein